MLVTNICSSLFHTKHVFTFLVGRNKIPTGNLRIISFKANDTIYIIICKNNLLQISGRKITVFAL